MTKIHNYVDRFLDKGYSKWIFIVPGAILIAFFAFPLTVIILRSINSDFFDHAFSGQAFKALRLSLVTSSITTIFAAGFGTPLAYMLAR